MVASLSIAKQSNASFPKHVATHLHSFGQLGQLAIALRRQQVPRPRRQRTALVPCELITALRHVRSNGVASHQRFDARIDVDHVAGHLTWPSSRYADRLRHAHDAHGRIELRPPVDLAAITLAARDNMTVSGQVESAAESIARATQCVARGFLSAPQTSAPAASRICWTPLRRAFRGDRGQPIRSGRCQTKPGGVT